MRLFDFLFPPRSDESALRDISIDDFLAQVAPRLISSTRPETIALLPFPAAPVRAAIHEAKYHGNAHAVEFLALALAEYLRDADDGFRKPIIVPVPLGKERLKERGFNQVHEVLNRALRSLGEEENSTIDSTFLERVRETVSQVELPDGRVKRICAAPLAPRILLIRHAPISLSMMSSLPAPPFKPPSMHCAKPALNISSRSPSRTKFDIVAQYGGVA